MPYLQCGCYILVAIMNLRLFRTLLTMIRALRDLQSAEDSVMSQEYTQYSAPDLCLAHQRCK